MKTIQAKRWVAAGTIGAMSVGGMLFTSTPAEAKPGNWKKAAIAAGVVTGYGLVKGKGRVATVGGAATAGSYYMYRKSKKKEQAREAQRRAWYQQRYGRNWQRHYRPGR